MKSLLTLALFLISFLIYSQTERGAHPSNDSLNQVVKDSISAAKKTNKTEFRGEVRSFYMQTINEESLKDDYALAVGAGLGVLTKSIYGFRFGMSGFFMYNALSSNIDKVDPQTNQPNRYEVGLFDLENPSQKTNLYRLENLFVSYTRSKSSITFGRMVLNTPFLNPQEGRMRPTMAEGVWINIAESTKFQFQGGWIQGIGARSTTHWYSVKNSIGLYPSGVNTDGSKSNYFHSLNSAGMAIANITFKPNSKLIFNLWDGYIDNIVNTAMIEINHTGFTNSPYNFYQSLLFLHQNAINAGGNENQRLTYINRGAQSNVISAQVGLKNKKFNTSLNYTHITGDGRYLMPREWGREVFYTFLPRERNEGFGNVHAFVLKTAFKTSNSNLKLGLGYGYYHLPDVKDYRLNKYAMPSYQQLNLDAAYVFNGFFKSLTLKTILLYKLQEGEDYGNLKVIYNKVNMFHLNVIIDYSF